MSEITVTPETLTPEVRPFPVPPPIPTERRLLPGQWGMIAFLFSEIAFFSTLIVTYIVFIGRDGKPGGLGGPTPTEVLSLPLVLLTTLCLLSSSVTAHLAEKALKQGHGNTFLQLWGGTVALGVVFLLGTAYEWTELIYHHHLTISRNLFGTTFYTLIGFHALHVTIGVVIMSLLLLLAFRGPRTTSEHTNAAPEVNHESIQIVSWYWHFVDAVWIVVFTVVYLLPHVA